MNNQILVRSKYSTLSIAGLDEKQVDIPRGARGVLITLETKESLRVAWVIWDQEKSAGPKPMLEDYIEVIGVRLGEHSFVVE